MAMCQDQDRVPVILYGGDNCTHPLSVKLNKDEWVPVDYLHSLQLAPSAVIQLMFRHVTGEVWTTELSYKTWGERSFDVLDNVYQSWTNEHGREEVFPLSIAQMCKLTYYDPLLFGSSSQDVPHKTKDDDDTEDDILDSIPLSSPVADKPFIPIDTPQPRVNMVDPMDHIPCENEKIASDQDTVRTALVISLCVLCGCFIVYLGYEFLVYVNSRQKRTPLPHSPSLPVLYAIE